MLFRDLLFRPGLGQKRSAFIMWRTHGRQFSERGRSSADPLFLRFGFAMVVTPCCAAGWAASCAHRLIRIDERVRIARDLHRWVTTGTDPERGGQGPWECQDLMQNRPSARPWASTGAMLLSPIPVRAGFCLYRTSWSHRQAVRNWMPAFLGLSGLNSGAASTRDLPKRLFAPNVHIHRWSSVSVFFPSVLRIIRIVRVSQIFPVLYANLRSQPSKPGPADNSRNANPGRGMGTARNAGLSLRTDSLTSRERHLSRRGSTLKHIRGGLAK